MVKALITGITGQDGSYLAELLLEKGYDVHGIIRRASTFNTQRIDHIFDKITLHHGDMTDESRLATILNLVRPDEVYNLAAQSHVKVSFDQPTFTADVDALGTLRLLESARAAQLPCKIYQASSSEMFGNITGPQNEQTPMRPVSPYGMSKLFSHNICKQYREAYGMFITCGILFNHESPRRGETFVTRKITRAATRIKYGLQKKLLLGSLDSERDWGYAGDYVEAMWLMMQQPKPKDYVIATGSSMNIAEFCNRVFNKLGLAWRDYVSVDAKYYRPVDLKSLIGDSSMAQSELGWKPKMSIDALIDLMVNSDLELAKNEAAYRANLNRREFSSGNE